MSRRRRDTKPDGTFWISYSDLATALLAVFVLILMATAAKHTKAAAEREAKAEVTTQKVNDLLRHREALAAHLKTAVKKSNDDVCGNLPPEKCTAAFQFVDQRVEVVDLTWFPPGATELSPVGKCQVQVFFRHLARELLMTGENIQIPAYLESIDVLGHTDPTWSRQKEWGWESYQLNLDTSQKRAAAVVTHLRSIYEPRTYLECIERRRPSAESPKLPAWQPFVALLNASGRSWTEAYCGQGESPVLLTPADFHERPAIPCADPDRADQRSRRVSFSFRLDDRAILGAILDELKDPEQPGALK